MSMILGLVGGFLIGYGVTGNQPALIMFGTVLFITALVVSFI